jgi:AcrR family transcriptional regulator
MPVSAATRTADRRAAILDAALAEFNAHGVAGASIDDIRRRSRASVGSIYHHFGGKDGIAAAIYLQGLGDYQDGFVVTLQRAATTRDGITAGVRHHLEWIEANPDLARFLFLGAATAPVAELRRLNRRFFGAVTRWLRPAVDRGELLSLSPELLSALWVGPSQELARHWLAGRTREPVADAADVLAEAAWRSLSKQGS